MALRKYLTEFIGTFFLVLTIGFATTKGGAENLAPLAIGAVLLAMVYMGGHVSGAHYNPAVSLAVLVRGKMPVADFIPYIIAQLGGAVVAALTVEYIRGEPFPVHIAKGIGMVHPLIAEFIFTFALALVVVNALGESPWGIFTVGATIPIALFMGLYVRFWRPGNVLEASVIGVVLLLLAVWGGQFVYGRAALAERLTLGRESIAWAMLAYGFAASVLPIWLLLAPRDYLSTFMKLGTIALLALGIALILPALRMPAVTPFGASGAGPVLAGKLFPFCFITIACGAISGFHSLIASGTTPKILAREAHARSVGYGAMCLESLVAIMALIAACSLEPGVYFSMNIKGEPADTAAKISALGYDASVEKMDGLAASVGEKTLFGRVGGAPTLAVGMAGIFAGVFNGRGLDLWYHFAIMFEALFILTTVDAGTRVGRYLLQDLLGQVWKPLGDTKKLGPAWLASFLVVAAWGWFLIQGVRDPLGGINSLWPVFGIANQLLAAIALCLATTVILKMQLSETGSGRPAYACVALVPLVWLLTVTMTAGIEKIWYPDPKIGFVAAASAVANPRLRFNWLLDAAVTGTFLLMILVIVVLSAREWILLLARRRSSRMTETAPVWLPDYAVAEARPRGLAGLLLIALMLAREWSGQTAMERVGRARLQPSHSDVCQQGSAEAAPYRLQCKNDRVHAYLQVAQKRFDGINRCC